MTASSKIVSDKSIAVITTGGTVGAAFGDGVTTLNHDSGLLHQQITHLAKRDGFDLRTFAPFSMFSEDMAPREWGKIMAQIEECLQLGFRRIVVTHGTDTMAYSAMATSLYYSRRGAKICFTGAFYPPSHPQSDAIANIEAALHAVSTDNIPEDVYVAFRRQGNQVTLTRAQDVVPMTPDENYFEALYGENVGTFISGDRWQIHNERLDPQILMDSRAPTVKELKKAPHQIIQLPCYPGMSLKHLKLNKQGESLIILDGYHSGTMPALALGRELKRLRETHPAAKVVMGMHPYRHVTLPYETTANLIKNDLITIYRDVLSYQLYALAICEGSKQGSIKRALKAAGPWRLHVPTTG